MNMKLHETSNHTIALGEQTPNQQQMARTFILQSPDEKAGHHQKLHDDGQKCNCQDQFHKTQD